MPKIIIREYTIYRNDNKVGQYHLNFDYNDSKLVKKLQSIENKLLSSLKRNKLTYTVIDKEEETKEERKWAQT